jgi:hypothetical protein
MTLKRLGDQVGGNKVTRSDLAHELATINGVQQFMGHNKLSESTGTLRERQSVCRSS